MPDTARRNRLHQQEPPGLDRRAARRHLHTKSDDLRPAGLRLNGLIRRLPPYNRYTPTNDGIHMAVCYTKVNNRLLVPLTAANQAQAPPELHSALTAITRDVDDYANRARPPAPHET